MTHAADFHNWLVFHRCSGRLFPSPSAIFVLLDPDGIFTTYIRHVLNQSTQEDKQDANFTV